MPAVTHKLVISASRRTDMPGRYYDVLASALQRGRIEVVNPFSGAVSIVDLSPERVHTLVLWSKDYGRVLADPSPLGPYRLYIIFTINDLPALEPNLPPLGDRLGQLTELAARYGPERICWRFDPVVFTGEPPRAGLDAFSRIGERVRAAGVTRAVFSFLDLYGKVRARNTRFGLGLVDPPRAMKRAAAADLAERTRVLGLDLESCAEEAEDVPGIASNGCIDGRLLSRLAGEPADISPDRNQRSLCRCTKSRDIGSYRDMPCPHGCLYCYANPVIPHTP